ncbi:NAD(P)/FAD-dependent oxidoreductase [Vulcanococcus limneticus]|uniref:NAD(P)/FAD-dependent oxidoreductase n=1 Tax=Vulcanococcus limneticus TaxID=2170428 RepID=UPI00398C0768
MPAAAPVVIVGGGFGGLSTALNLSARQGHPPLLLIEPQERFLFLPLLYELLSGELRRWQIAPRYDQLLAGRGVAWLQERVTGIDTGARHLQTSGGRTLAYSRLVLATGGRPETYGVPGVKEHALGFRSLADVERLQALVRQLKGQARPLQRLVVVGAGASGVELICKLADLLEGSTVLELVEQGPDLLPLSKSFNRDQARLALQRRDIRLRTGTRVEAVQADGVSLSRAGTAGERQREQLRADGVIWTGGVAGAVPSITPAPSLDPRGRLHCSAELQVEGLPELFALGDAAVGPAPAGDEDGSGPAGPAWPATAQVAFQQAERVADNVLRSLAAEPLQPFQWNDLGEMLGLGIGQATLTGLGLTLAGPGAEQLRRLAYLARLPGLPHQLRVAAGWLAAGG